MPWLHVPDALLASFVRGTLPDDEASSVALHIDDCGACQARATSADPLSQAFASVDEPALPTELITGVLARVETGGPRLGAAVPAAGVGLAAAAALVLLLVGDPSSLLSGLGALIRAAEAILRAVDVPLALITPVWFAAAALSLAGAAITTRRMEGRETLWR
ncbi:MAG: hypothetical protein GXP62_04720 [Oligoflexia bacterium]|nr:hypothetical protein [Oligoflexia bacterium]